jgi:hypothetical protein
MKYFHPTIASTPLLLLCLSSLITSDTDRPNSGFSVLTSSFPFRRDRTVGSSMQRRIIPTYQNEEQNTEDSRRSRHVLSHRKQATDGGFSGVGDCGGAGAECRAVPAMWLQQ